VPQRFAVCGTLLFTLSASEHPPFPYSNSAGS